MSRRFRFGVALLATALAGSTGFAEVAIAVPPVTRIPVGLNPFRVVVDPVDRLVYVGGSGATGGAVIVMNADTGVVNGIVAIPGMPRTMVLDPAGGGVLLSQGGSGFVERIRGQSLSRGTPIQMPYFNVKQIVVDTVLNRLIANANPLSGSINHLVAVDLASGTAVSDLVLPEGRLAIDSPAGRLYKMVFAYTLEVRATTTLGLIATIQHIEDDHGFGSLVLDSSRGRFYSIGNNALDSHQIIDAGSGVVIGRSSRVPAARRTSSSIQIAAASMSATTRPMARRVSRSTHRTRSLTRSRCPVLTRAPSRSTRRPGTYG